MSRRVLVGAVCAGAASAVVVARIAGIAIAVGGGATFVAGCASVTGADVTYVDGGAAGHGAADGAADAGAPPVSATVDGGCAPCTEQGLICCAAASGRTCAATAAECAGVVVGCSSYDPTSDSACCWNAGAPGATGSSTAYAAACGARPTACVGDGDCAGTTGPCRTTECGGVALGTCGGAAPACPP